ncbi:MAG: response regulator transcription factor [Flavobacteriaceae bacterium]|nr:response regulator transcription factor [Flavobacteriaceae bacterium]
MTKIIIADDHKIIIEGLTSLVTENDNICIVGTAENGLEALSLLEKNEVDIAVLDIEMPEIDGLDLTKIIKEKFPKTKVLILTMHDEIGFIRKMMEAGVNGYILKNKGKEELITAINTLNDNKGYFGEDVKNTVMNSMRSKNVIGEIELTKKEIEVLKLIANGDKASIIAEKLYVSEATVNTHRRNLIAKTGVRNSIELTKFAIKSGYIQI